jgi:hypothetical protein
MGQYLASAVPRLYYFVRIYQQSGMRAIRGISAFHRILVHFSFTREFRPPTPECTYVEPKHAAKRCLGLRIPFIVTTLACTTLQAFRSGKMHTMRQRTQRGLHPSNLNIQSVKGCTITTAGDGVGPAFVVVPLATSCHFSHGFSVDLVRPSPILVGQAVPLLPASSP